MAPTVVKFWPACHKSQNVVTIASQAKKVLRFDDMPVNGVRLSLFTTVSFKKKIKKKNITVTNGNGVQE